MPQEPQEMVRTRMLGMLLDKVEADTYPSSTMLDLVEMLLKPEELEDYADVLLTKMESENYPSLSLVRRLIALT